MVAKIITGKSIRGILHYNENKVEAGEARLMMASGFAGEIDRMDFSQKFNRFKHLTELNARVKTNALHISLNFHQDDRPTDEKLQLIASDYMERIGFGDQPFLVYRHEDSGHPHIHLVSTNIRKDGSRIDLHNIGKKLSEPARKALEVKYHLVKAEGLEKHLRGKLEKLRYGDQPTKRAIANIVTRVSQEYAFSNFVEFKTLLAHFGVHADRGAMESKMFKKNGLQYFCMDKQGNPKGVPVKASSIYKKPTMMNIEKRFTKNTEKKTGCKQAICLKLDKVWKGQHNLSLDQFVSALEQEPITPVFRRSADGQLFGITYIDHQHKVIFNGSELGKSYSAKAVSERLEQKTLSAIPRERIARKAEKTMVQKIDENLNPPTPLPLLDLLTKPSYDPDLSIPKRRKKRRKGKKQNQEITL